MDYAHPQKCPPSPLRAWEDCIIHLDCHDDMDPSFDPLREIPLFWSRFLNPVTKHRDALIYYFGFSVDTGAWALTWTDSQLESKVCIIEPSMVLPPAGPQDGVPGAGGSMGVERWSPWVASSFVSGVRGGEKQIVRGNSAIFAG